MKNTGNPYECLGMGSILGQPPFRAESLVVSLFLDTFQTNHKEAGVVTAEGFLVFTTGRFDFIQSPWQASGTTLNGEINWSIVRHEPANVLEFVARDSDGRAMFYGNDGVVDEAVRKLVGELLTHFTKATRKNPDLLKGFRENGEPTEVLRAMTVATIVG